ncbi:MAG: T9SS type A sorting domain-containing protein, partial [Sphingobacteriales bacterium]
SSSYDPDGTITAYQWTKISGPAQFTIAAPTQKQTAVNGLVQGVYKFELKVTDNQGAIGKDTVTVTVNQGLPPNQLPVANAGNNMVITLPTNAATLNGSSSYDPDGTITAYQWTKIAGPAQFTIATPTQKQTAITNLVQGSYAFELKVTDNQGGIGKDTMIITVSALTSTPNQLPVAEAGDGQTITIPVNSVQLDGSTSHDPDGTIISHSWVMVSGPSQPVLVTSNAATTTVNGLVAGEYKFRLTVIDNKGAQATDEVIITVLPGESSAKVYPNPAVNVLNLVIESNTQRNNTDVQIFDARGNKVHHEQFFRDMPRITRQIDVSSLAKGVYFIKIQVDINHAKTIQFLKQ